MLYTRCKTTVKHTKKLIVCPTTQKRNIRTNESTRTNDSHTNIPLRVQPCRNTLIGTII